MKFLMVGGAREEEKLLKSSCHLSTTFHRVGNIDDATREINAAAASPFTAIFVLTNSDENRASKLMLLLTLFMSANIVEWRTTSDDTEYLNVAVQCGGGETREFIQVSNASLGSYIQFLETDMKLNQKKMKSYSRKSSAEKKLFSKRSSASVGHNRIHSTSVAVAVGGSPKSIFKKSKIAPATALVLDTSPAISSIPATDLSLASSLPLPTPFSSPTLSSLPASTPLGSPTLSVPRTVAVSDSASALITSPTLTPLQSPTIGSVSVFQNPSSNPLSSPRGREVDGPSDQIMSGGTAVEQSAKSEEGNGSSWCSC